MEVHGNLNSPESFSCPVAEVLETLLQSLGSVSDLEKMASGPGGSYERLAAYMDALPTLPPFVLQALGEGLKVFYLSGCLCQGSDSGFCRASRY